MTSRPITSPRMKSLGKPWIEDWDPEDDVFWEGGGKQIARRNLIWSIFAEHLGFSVWLFWSLAATLLAAVGYTEFTPTQLFMLVAVPNLVGSLIRLPYTFAVPKFGGRNWTVVSALLLVIPTLLFALATRTTGTPYWVFVLIAATAGFGGGNFASSMANINFFYPAKAKGAALGLNAAGGNLGVAVIQFLLPILVGGAAIFGLVQASGSGIRLERAGYLYAGLAVVAAICAWLFMDNLKVTKSRPRETLSVLKHKHTWVMSFLYIGTFGSFIGYSAAMPLLIKINFAVPNPDNAAALIGINPAYWAFLGAFVGSIARPFGGWLSDKVGGARVTFWTFVAMIAGTGLVLYSLKLLTPNPNQLPSIAESNEQYFPFFLLAFLFVFMSTGIGNGSTYRMIPLIWQAKARESGPAGSPQAKAALTKSTKESSAVIGIAGAIGALGGFLIPIIFGAPWVENPVDAVQGAFLVFISFYAACLSVTWFVYTRRTFLVHRVPSLAHAAV